MRNKIVTVARSYIGVPFRHQGRTRLGIDCVGLLICVVKELSLPCADESNYQRRTNGLTFISKFRKAGVTQKNILDRLPGDIIVIKQENQACHVAIYCGDEKMVHSYALRRKVVEEPYIAHWFKMTASCYTFPGVD